MPRKTSLFWISHAWTFIRRLLPTIKWRCHILIWWESVKYPVHFRWTRYTILIGLPGWMILNCSLGPKWPTLGNTCVTELRSSLGAWGTPIWGMPRERSIFWIANECLVLYMALKLTVLVRGREDNEPHWTGKWWARLILFECNSPDSPRPWRWRTNQTGLWDAEFAWFSPSTTDWIWLYGL